MQKDLFSSVFGRKNKLRDAIFGFFFDIASYPRLLLEAFIRSKMGRRYFRISSVITVALILFWLPAGLYGGERLFRYYNGNFNETSFWGRYATWYLFIVLFSVFSNERVKEIYTHSNVYDFNHFSLSSGISLEFFYKLPFFKNRPKTYTVEVFLEPAFFVLIGFILIALGQPVGFLLMVSAICYGFSYAAGYQMQDDYFQDLIDKMILNEELINAFVYDLPPQKTRGVKFNRKPSDENMRRKMAPKFFPDEDDDDRFEVK